MKGFLAVLAIGAVPVFLAALLLPSWRRRELEKWRRSGLPARELRPEERRTYRLRAGGAIFALALLMGVTVPYFDPSFKMETFADWLVLAFFGGICAWFGGIEVGDEAYEIFDSIYRSALEEEKGGEDGASR